MSIEIEILKDALREIVTDNRRIHRLCTILIIVIVLMLTGFIIGGQIKDMRYIQFINEFIQ